MEQLIQIDQNWLVAINNWHAAWADSVMWIISAKLTWLPLYALLVGMLFWRFGWKKALIMLCFFGVAVGLSDFISSGIIKHLVCRPRPTHEPALQGMLHIVNGYQGGMYGFVSSHAANTMSCGLLFSLIWKNWKATLPLMLWVALNCYSRMYLGVHYPGDIIGGLIVGAMLAVMAYWALKKVLAYHCMDGVDVVARD